MRCFDKYKGDGNVNVPREYPICCARTGERFRHEYVFTPKYCRISWKSRELVQREVHSVGYVKIKGNPSIRDSACMALNMYVAMKVN